MWFDEMHHVIVFLQIILQRCSRENDASFRSNLIQCFGNSCLGILEHVTFVTHDDVWTGIAEKEVVIGVVRQSPIDFVSHQHHSALLVPFLQTFPTRRFRFHLRELIDFHRGSKAGQPMREFIRPIRRDIHRTKNQTRPCPSQIAMFEDRVKKRDQLKGFAPRTTNARESVDEPANLQSHVMCKDTACHRTTPLDL